MSRVSIQQMADRVSTLIETRMKVSGASLEVRLKRTGNRLPRKVRDAVEALVQATEMAQNPKLLMQIDHEAVAIAYDIAVRHLNGIGRSARRRGMLLDAGARVAFALLVLGAAVLGLLHWRGFI